MNILLIEDDLATAQSIELMLKAEGWRVSSTDLGEEGFDLARLYEYDIVLLDIGLPDIAGTEVLRRMRQAKVTTPVIMVTGDTKIDTQTKCFDLGADDYMTKPFHRDLLVARCRAVHRRARGLPTNNIVFGQFELNMGTQTLTCCEQNVHLTGKEYELLEKLVVNMGRTLTKVQLMNALYDDLDQPEIKIIDVFVCKLRRIMMQACGENHLDTVWGRGYVLQKEPLATTRKLVDYNAIRPDSTSARILRHLAEHNKTFSTADLLEAMDVNKNNMYSAVHFLRLRGYIETITGLNRNTSRHTITPAGLSHVINLNEKVTNETLSPQRSHPQGEGSPHLVPGAGQQDADLRAGAQG